MKTFLSENEKRKKADELNSKNTHNLINTLKKYI